jgi:hypothetical protein
MLVLNLVSLKAADLFDSIAHTPNQKHRPEEPTPTVVRTTGSNPCPPMDRRLESH